MYCQKKPQCGQEGQGRVTKQVKPAVRTDAVPPRNPNRETLSLLLCSFLWYFSYFYTSVQWIIKTDDEYYDQIVIIAIEEPEVL